MPSFPCSRLECAGWTFTSERALNEHWESSPDHPYCTTCCLRLPNQAKLDYHRHSRHPYCAEHDRYFPSKEALFCVDCEALFEDEMDRRKHYFDSDKHASCDICRKGFRSDDALIAHYKSTANEGHYICTLSSCPRNIFEHEESLVEHYVKHASAHFYCIECKIKFAHDYAIEQHFNAAAAHKSPTRDDSTNEGFYCTPCQRSFSSEFNRRRHLATNTRHNYCFQCSKDFESEHALEVHTKSFAHKPRDIACPCGCDKAFKLRSSVLDHLASGQCANLPRIGRREVNASARSAGVPGVISPTGGTYERNWPTVATERSYNPVKRVYECFVCEKEFPLLNSLNQHLASGAHDRSHYRCTRKRCGQEFRGLSDYVRHLEDEASSDKGDFRRVKKTIGGYTKKIVEDLVEGNSFKG
ncbi:hypothetical protein BDZ89DRAFT_1065029 [Hymenopellis radicata]|nr:hypothetical protein BDZ89DRAFT_1065029 [Hymenopellis radicata]